MVARTLSPLSALTRNIAFGSASSTTPSNSSLSPLGSLRSRRSLTPTSSLPHSPSLYRCRLRLFVQDPQDVPRHVARRERPIDPPEQPFCLVIRQKRCGHGFVSIQAFGDCLRLVVGAML